jgi:type III secretory pathway component EscS
MGAFYHPTSRIFSSFFGFLLFTSAADMSGVAELIGNLTHLIVVVTRIQTQTLLLLSGCLFSSLLASHCF